MKKFLRNLFFELYIALRYFLFFESKRISMLSLSAIILIGVCLGFTLSIITLSRQLKEAQIKDMLSIDGDIQLTGYFKDKKGIEVFLSQHEDVKDFFYIVEKNAFLYSHGKIVPVIHRYIHPYEKYMSLLYSFPVITFAENDDIRNTFIGHDAISKVQDSTKENSFVFIVYPEYHGDLVLDYQPLLKYNTFRTYASAHDSTYIFSSYKKNLDDNKKSLVNHYAKFFIYLHDNSESYQKRIKDTLIKDLSQYTEDPHEFHFWQDRYPFLKKVFRLQKYAFFTIVIFFVIISSFAAFVTLFLLYQNNKISFCILHSLGFSISSLSRIIMYKGFFIAFMSNILCVVVYNMFLYFIYYYDILAVLSYYDSDAPGKVFSYGFSWNLYFTSIIYITVLCSIFSYYLCRSLKSINYISLLKSI